MKAILKFSFFLLLLVSCNDSKSFSTLGNANLNMTVENEDRILQKKSLSSEKIQTERKLVKKGFIEFESKDLEKSYKSMVNAVKKYNAYLAVDKSYKSSSRISNTLKVRIPAKNFDTFLSDISKNVTHFDHKEITINDVTEQFLDTEARLKTKKELENRFLEILKKAKKVSEILEVERQIGNLRTEIESIEGRLKYLKNQVSFSTLNITFYKTISSETNFSKKIKNGFKNGMNNLIWFFVFLINLWPFIIILIIFTLLYKRWRKNRN